MCQTIESDIVRNKARGAWLSVLGFLAPELEKAIEKPGRHIGCPVHGGKDGFKLFRDADISGGGICNTCGAKPDGFSVLMWIRGWSFPDALTAVANVLGVSSDPAYRKPIVLKPAVARPKPNPDYRKVKAIMQTVWHESKSIRHPDAEPVRLYLQSRGLDTAMPDWQTLRFHPNMKYLDKDGKLVGHFPAMLALVEKDSIPINIHRTFLTADGQKAPVTSPRKLFPAPPGHLTGSAIRLGNPGRILSVTEGIETALAVVEATGMVTWPLINTALMSSFLIPPGVEKLVIWADLDRKNAGMEAASILTARAIAQGVEVDIRKPEGPIPDNAKSIDWLDVLNQQDPNAFAVRSCS